jgi:S-adenosylmethionine decarboxylase
MFSQIQKSSGKHMICDIKQINNFYLLNNSQQIKNILNFICDKYNFTVLNIIEHQFLPQGFTILFLLSESHISIHTFPERNYIAFDIYTCREYSDNLIYQEIYEYLIIQFQAKMETPLIIERVF